MDNRFFTLSALTSIAGIMLLTMAAQSIDPPETSINQVSGEFLDENLKITERVCRVHTFDTQGKIVTICNEERELDIYLPKNVARHFTEEGLRGKSVQAIGTLQYYKGSLELIVSKPSHLKVK